MSFNCKKFVEIPPPTTQLVNTSVFSDNNTANSAQLGIFTQMWSTNFSFDISYFLGISADEFTNYSTNAAEKQLYSNSLVPANTDVSLLWSNFYKLIYQSNAVLENLAASSGVSDSVKNQLTGEAKFTRAYVYFYLVNLFGDVPLALSSDYSTNATLPRASTDQVYKQMVLDLTDAQTLLNSNYVTSDGITQGTDRVRPTKSAAFALLSRIFLYTHDWINAEAQATKVIDNTDAYSLLPDLNNVFLAGDNKEAIFQVMGAPYNTIDGINFILTTTPSQVAISPQLLASYEPGDNRRIDWVDSVIADGQTYYFPYKYKVGTTSAPISEYTMLLRFAEQYLNRSEARAEQGNIDGPAGAVADLNIIRHRAGLPDYNGFMDQASVLSAILHERQTELFSEEGHRWLDLKRTNTVNQVMTVVTPQKNGIWITTQQLYPIPQNDRTLDPNLSQNAGY